MDGLVGKGVSDCMGDARAQAKTVLSKAKELVKELVKNITLGFVFPRVFAFAAKDPV